MKKLIVILAMGMIAPTAFASGVWTAVTVGTVTGLTSNGYIQVSFSANSTGTTCATTRNYALIDISTSVGLYNAALAQTAKLSGSGQTVTVQGTGSCVGAIETVSYVTEN